jgi:DNA-binding MarR family transcriptional regulator/GNAT superfamily N-acetyltransferase
MQAMVAQVRSFNRLVAERIGAMDQDFLGRQRPLAEARLLWEIGEDGCDVRELRHRLGLDSGYLARLLRALERQRLVAVAAASGDRRVRRARLTAAGLAERAELERRSDALATSLLDPLSEDQRSRLTAAMAEVERLLVASMVRVAVEDPQSPDARWCRDRYFAELDRRFAGGFDPVVSDSADASELAPPAGVLLLARLRRRPVGCGALRLGPDRAGEVKQMWVAPETRGLGLGRRLLRELEAVASERGVVALRLETNRALTEAISLYRASGYREVEPFGDEPYAHHWFEKRLSPGARNRE